MTRMLHPVQSSQADTGEEVVGARMFKLAKDSAVKSRTQTINQLQAVLVSADPARRESLSGLPTTKPSRRTGHSTQLAPVGADPGTRDGVAAPA